tara:strand:+ start:495 stop:686 length:192 start_codon:yes stop_codon:yes gene_type:complete
LGHGLSELVRPEIRAIGSSAGEALGKSFIATATAPRQRPKGRPKSGLLVEEHGNTQIRTNTAC